MSSWHRLPTSLGVGLFVMAAACAACRPSTATATSSPAPSPAHSTAHAAAPHVEPERPLAVKSAAAAARPLLPIRPSTLCFTSGKVAMRGPEMARVNVGCMRGVVAGSTGQIAELDFTYLGPSATTVPLANGELRRQIGIKLRAKDSCNVVYAMWHVTPRSGISVSVKHNAGASTHEECGAGGYEGLKSAKSPQPIPDLGVGGRHTLRAEIDGRDLRVTADGALAFEGPLPPEAFAFDGPAGVRSDNGEFDFELLVPALARDARCP